jgi:EAL domain-containing protein (putative c-di-GMP-specific phosphodiesterase class I)
MKRYSLVFIIAATLVALLIQMYLPYILLELFAQSLGFLGILLSIENEDDIINQITKVYNRYAFLEMTPEKIGKADCAFIVVKLQDLSYYNTTIGVTRTNEYLRLIAARLSKLDRRFLCYDLAGGRFVLIGSGVYAGEREKFKDETYNMFKNPWEHKGLEVQFPALICSDSADTLSSIEELLLTADSPFDGSDTVIVDIHDITTKHKRRILIEKLIRDAINQKTFQVYYQPIWDYHTGKVRSAEALCRLIDDEFGFIAPDEFIPIAEQNGTVLEIGRFVFEEVCRFYKEGGLQDLGINYIEVNLSVVQCVSRNIKESFDEILKKYNLDSNCINLEITESATADNHKVLIDTIGKLSESGFSFSLDDYGTGYSNIAYMYEMPFSIIKIDKSILWKAMQPENGEGLDGAIIYLENTIRMLKNMNYYVLVEGVETLEQKMLLERFGCDYFQGFYFSKPVQKQVFADYLKVVNA